MPSEGFMKAATNNLPSVDMFMIMEFIKNDERFNAAELRGAKSNVSTREQYGDNAIGYVEVKREGPLCTLQCQVCPEHRVRSKNYVVCLTVNEEEEKILDVVCRDCAASLGGCKHALAFLMWAHRRSEEPSPTDITSYWMRPRLSAVGTSVRFITAANFSNTATCAVASTSTSAIASTSTSAIASTSTSDIASTSAIVSTSTSAVALTPVSASTFRSDITAIGKAANLEGQILRYSSDAYKERFDNLSLHKLMSMFRAQGGVQCDDFISFCTSTMTNKLCEEGEKASKGQANSPLWRELRYGRITASKLYDFSRCETPDGTLVESIIGAYKIKDNKFMKRGRLLEKEVIKHVKNTRKMKFSDSCGFFSLPSLPMFGASPDGLSQKYVVEVKCPSSDKTLKNYIRNGEITQKFKAQIHLQMVCAERKKGLFCVASPNFEKTKSVQILEIDFDETFVNELLLSARSKWEKFVYPKLYDSV